MIKVIKQWLIIMLVLAGSFLVCELITGARPTNQELWVVGLPVWLTTSIAWALRLGWFDFSEEEENTEPDSDEGHPW